MVRKTFANREVLDFYKTLPFNAKGMLKEEIKAIRERDVTALYPGLDELLSSLGHSGNLGLNKSVLDVGCGTGWLSNFISFRYNLHVVGIDFNPIAIGIAKEVAKAMGLTTKFLVKDLFLYQPRFSFDLVLSFGVVHHTNKCKFAV